MVGLAMVLFSFSGAFTAQAGCDTTPDVGQTVGNCVTLSGPWGEINSCTLTNEGSVCYFGGGGGEIGEL